MKRKLVLVASLIVLGSMVFLLIKERRNRNAQDSGGVTIAADGTIVANPPQWSNWSIVADLKKSTNSTATPKGGPNGK
jgi:hypothetical protein